MERKTKAVPETTNRCEAARSTRSPGEPAPGPGGRCPNTASYNLLNAGRVQGRACEGCARRLAADIPWLTLEPLKEAR